MKLYLSSNGLGASAGVLRDLVGAQGRAALVLNARDVDEVERDRYLRQESADLASLGFRCEELDLRSYFGDVAGLRARLERCDLVWVVGGNTFVLARAMTQARFGAAIHDPLTTGRIVYAGYSAGACVTGPDLSGCHLMDQADAEPRGYEQGIPPDALDWVPWRIVPHWESDHEEAPSADRAVAHLRASGLAYRALRDGQVIVVDGPAERLHSPG